VRFDGQAPWDSPAEHIRRCARVGTILSVTPRPGVREAERSHSFLKIARGFFVNRADHVAIVVKCADYVLGDCGARQAARCAALEGAMFSLDADGVAAPRACPGRPCRPHPLASVEDLVLPLS
jgi:hypothetical protein